MWTVMVVKHDHNSYPILALMLKRYVMDHVVQERLALPTRQNLLFLDSVFIDNDELRITCDVKSEQYMMAK